VISKSLAKVINHIERNYSIPNYYGRGINNSSSIFTLEGRKKTYKKKKKKKKKKTLHDLKLPQSVQLSEMFGLASTSKGITLDSPSSSSQGRSGFSVVNKTTAYLLLKNGRSRFNCRNYKKTTSSFKHRLTSNFRTNVFLPRVKHRKN
jgi:hypothetical protein